MSSDLPQRREALAGLLWPGFPERSARSSLRNALANLRLVLRERACSGDGAACHPFPYSTRQTIQFNSQSDHWLDAVAFEGSLAAVLPTREGLEQAVGLVRGPFLDGFVLAGAAPFEESLLLCREHSSGQLPESLDQLVPTYEAQGAYEQALARARRRVDLEPWQKDSPRQLMRLLARNGRRTGALAQF